MIFHAFLSEFEIVFFFSYLERSIENVPGIFFIAKIMKRIPQFEKTDKLFAYT